jgi:quercetin dioxygenase-like cupin family protein
MSAFTVIPAATIASGTDRKEWGSLSWFASRALAGTAGLTVGRVVIKAGQSNPRHAHPNCEEVLYLLDGELEHTAGDEVVHLRPGDALVMKANVFHNARSVGDRDADMLVIFSSGDREFVAEPRD